MGYFGVGILVASLSVVVYKYKIPATWAEKGSTDNLGSDLAKDDLKDAEVFDESQRKGPSISVVEPDAGVDERRDAPIVKQDGPTAVKPILDSHIKRVTPTEPVQQPTPPAMPPPARPTQNAKRKIELAPTSPMPPLSPPVSKIPPKPSTTLRPPPSTASTLRAPPSRSLAPPTSTLVPSTSTLAPSSRLSKKVLLDPGHSPLDWAHLTANPPTPTFLRGKDVAPNLIRVPPSLLKYHSGRKGKDAWGVWQAKVYNLTPYMKFHPGGVDQLMKGAGKEGEGEKLFNEVHPWVSWENMLGECLVGILVSENEAQTLGEGQENSLDEMD